MRFISKLSFFAFPKGRVFLGFLAVLLTFPACQNPTDTEDAPSPEKPPHHITVTKREGDNLSPLIGHLLEPGDLIVNLCAEDNTIIARDISGFDISDYGRVYSRASEDQSNGETFKVKYGSFEYLFPVTMHGLNDFQASNTTGIEEDLKAVAYNNSTSTWYVAGEDNSNAKGFSSTNLASAWTSITGTGSGTTSAINAIACGGGLVVAGGAGQSGQSQTGGLTFYNGSSWTFAVSPTVNPADFTINAIAYGNGKFVAVGNAGLAGHTIGQGTSAEPIAKRWEIISGFGPFYGSGDIKCVIHDGSRFIAAGAGGGIVSSSNGRDWALLSSYGSSIKSMAYGKVFDPIRIKADRYVIIVELGSTSMIAYSSDARTWQPASNIFTDPDLQGTNFTALTYNGDGLFVAVGKRTGTAYTGIDGSNKMKIAYSVDGITWTAKSTLGLGSATLNAVAHGNGTFVAVGDNKKIFYSTN
jgi:hypothetical protein